MTYDVIVIGAGLGGLGAAARLARAGRSVLILEAGPHSGGTSHVFHRSGFGFPMGPLSCSHPRRVRAFLKSIEADQGLTFRRNHFQVTAPGLDIIISHPFHRLGDDLAAAFPDEKGIQGLMTDLSALTARAARALDRGRGAQRGAGPDEKPESRPPVSTDPWMSQAARIPCEGWLRKRIGHPGLVNLIGSMSSDPPHMSLLNLGVMWNLMSRVGIWTPSEGIQSLGERMASAFLRAGGEIRISTGAEKILIGPDGVEGVRTGGGETLRSRWVISNVDYKTTFLDLVESARIPKGFRQAVADVPYTGSELCVYLGVDPARVDWNRMRSVHLLYQSRIPDPSRKPDPLNFSARQIEICRWSDNAPGLTPPGMASLVLRVGLPYRLFSEFRTGFRKRVPEYRARKAELAGTLIRAAEEILPGLESAVRVREAATPLTYADWGRRRLGSIAGWTWGAKPRDELTGPLLVATPVPRLLCAGIYAASDLFLGGVPTALHTAEAAAGMVAAKNGTS